MKKHKKNETPKKVKEPLIKTKVKPDNSIEVELKNPANSILGKVFIYILVFGMVGGSLVALLYLILEAINK